MKVLDVADFQQGIEETLGQLKTLKNQLNHVQKSVEGVAGLDDALKGETGQAIRSFYRECHLPFLKFFDQFITNYTSRLNQTKKALHILESASNGLIRESFLEYDLEQGLRKTRQITTELTDDANKIIRGVADIVALPKLHDDDFTENVRLARKEKRETAEKLNIFDLTQSKDLKAVQDDLQTMNQYVREISSMVKSGGISITHFKINQLKKVPSYQTITKTDSKGQKDLLSILMDFNPFSSINNVGDVFLTLQTAAGITLVGTSTVQIHPKDGNRKKAVIHTADWVKGKGNNEFLKRLAKRMDKTIRNPGPIMKTVKGIDGFVDKYAHIQVTGLSKARGFENWLKTVVAGIDSPGIPTRKIPGMIAKRVYPLDATINIGEEAWNIGQKWKNGNLNIGKDVSVGLANVAINTGASWVGALAGGALGTLIGPPGTAAGTYIGGYLGSRVGDALSGFAETAIRKGPGVAFREAGVKMNRNVQKGFKWAKGLFK